MPSPLQSGFADNPILVTGSAGFIGSNFVLEWVRQKKGKVVSIDKLTYAGNRANLAEIENDPLHVLFVEDIGNKSFITDILQKFAPRAVVNFAAESHVDRSIHKPEDFVQTNVVGTFRLLEACVDYFNGLPQTAQDSFRFLHVSTDEVYGSLEADEPAFTEYNRAQPNSPYAASKAASDHFVRAFHHTYGLPVLTTNCSNNYGPYQFPEKLIPLMINNALTGKSLPIYGDGTHIRDWLYVGDHCSAIQTVLALGKVGETYNIGGNCEMKNSDVVLAVCRALDQRCPRSDGHSYQEQIAYVKDRLGHDRRYAMNIDKIGNELGWQPQETFESGISKTVQWYIDHRDWVEAITTGAYHQWIELNYDDRQRKQS